MTYASQQLADALQELAREPIDKKGYGITKIPSTLDAKDADLEFPPAVAKFLEATSTYSESTKAVSIGVY